MTRSATGDYRVRVVTTKGLRQRHHVQIVAANGELVRWSEKYRDKAYALEVATGLVKALGASGVEFVAK